MKKQRAADLVPFCLFLCVLMLSLLHTAEAQRNDYPPVQGNGEASATGERRLSVPGQAEAPGPADILTAPRPSGNERLSQPGVPSGDAEEKYTGTKPFGGIGGTGITPTGPEQYR